MSNLVEYAKEEFQVLGYQTFKEPSWFQKFLVKIGLKKEEFDYDYEIQKCIIEILKTFSKQQHSGMSAGYVIGALEKLLRFEPLSPLTGEDWEWTEVEPGCYQNRRCFRVFKGEDGVAYDSEGYIYTDEHGLTFTSKHSRKNITFPYVPSSKVIGRQKSKKIHEGDE